MTRKLSCVLAPCLLLCALALPAWAQWYPTGVPVATALADQSAAVTAPDGSGGLYVVWQDYRNGGVGNGLFDIYAQHVLSSGATDPAWAAGGMPVCALPEAQTMPSVLADGAGGAFVTWLDRRGVSHNVAYMTRLTPTGLHPAWPANGVALTDTAGVIDWEVQMVSDGSTGVYAMSPIFQVYRDLRVQHVSASGVLDPNFTAAGVRAGIIDYWGNRGESITTDGAGGVLIAWKTGGTRTYANRVLASGVTDPAWPPGGLLVQTTGVAAQFPTLVADGTGGAVVVWGQYGGVDFDIHAQHVHSNGTLDTTWPAGGVPVCAASGNQQSARSTSDGAGGAYVAWSDMRATGDYDIYVQRVRAGGSVDPAWPVDGLLLSSLLGAQFVMGIGPDGEGGAYVLWEDVSSSRRGIYVQRVDASGTVSAGWPAGGALITGLEQGLVSAGFSSDGAGNLFAAWHEYRKGNSNPRALDVYARKIPLTGTHRLTTGQGGGSAAYLLVPDSLSVFWSSQTTLAALDVTSDDEIEFRFPSYASQSLVTVTANGQPREVAPNQVFRGVTQDIALEARWSYDPWAVSTALPGGKGYAALAWPMTFANDSVSTLLDELWPTNDFMWRLARWNPAASAYDYAGGALTRLAPGQGYWLATTSARTLEVAGRPLYLPTTDVPLLGDGASGWNQVANPYRFPVADSALRVVAGASVVPFTGAANTSTDSTVWEWSGGSSYSRVHTLLPNRAYWVRKSAAGSVALRFPNLTSVGRIEPPTMRPDDADWALAFTASQGEALAAPVWMGAWRTAAASAPLRREAPPASPEGGLRLAVARANAPRVNAESEFVPSGTAAAWQIEVAGAEAPGEVTLELAGFELPAGLALRLSDPLLGWARAVSPGERITLAATPGTRRLLLEAREGIPQPTGETGPKLFAAWPNPFRGSLGFTAQLLAGGDVRVDIHDVQGRLVRSLDRRFLPAGESVTVWDGRGSDGAIVRPGVYLARWRAAGRDGVVRLVKLD